MNNEVLKELWAITKKYGPGVGLTVLATVLSACGAKPQITTTIESCGGQEEVDAQPGVLRKIVAPGITMEYMVNPDGSTTWFSKPRFTDIPPYAGRPLGGTTEEHLLADLQGDIDGDGNQDIKFKSVCPTPSKPTLSPQPPATPTGYLGKGIGRLASLPRGFHPNSGKPALSRRI